MSYWRECISAAFDDAGIEASADQITAVALWVEEDFANYGMAHGHDVSQPPVDTAKDQEIANLKREVEELKSDVMIYRKSVARRRNVSPSDVELEKHGKDNGDVVYYRR